MKKYKITVQHYLPSDSINNQEKLRPVYIRVIYKRASNTFKSRLINDKFSSEDEIPKLLVAKEIEDIETFIRDHECKNLEPRELLKLYTRSSIPTYELILKSIKRNCIELVKMYKDTKDSELALRAFNRNLKTEINATTKVTSN